VPGLLLIDSRWLSAQRFQMPPLPLPGVCAEYCIHLPLSVRQREKRAATGIPTVVWGMAGRASFSFTQPAGGGSAGAAVRHIDPRSALLPPNAASEWRPSLPACSASVAFSCVRSVSVLTDERFLHFQLRRDTGRAGRSSSSRGIEFLSLQCSRHFPGAHGN
jgi:hypothetical protein